MLRLEFMVLFQHGVPDVVVQWVQICRARGPLSLLNEPARVQSVLHDARTLRNEGCLGRNSIIVFIFRYISTKRGERECIFDRLRVEKIPCKNLHELLKYQQVSRGSILFARILLPRCKDSLRSE